MLVAVADGREAGAVVHDVRAVAGARRRAVLDAALVVAVLAAANVVAHFTVPWASFVAVPGAAVLLLVLARWRGLGWAELGLARRQWRGGARWGAAAVSMVALAVAVGALLPWTRPLYLNDAYAALPAALLASLVLIPLQTAIPEEIAFRGALHGTLSRVWGARGVAAAGSVLFGCWHVSTSLGLTAGNVGLSRIVGVGTGGVVTGVVLAVVVTGFAGWVFTWLRRRSDSLLAPIALHWALNGMGALAAALVWQAMT